MQIAELLKEGQEILVQIAKEPLGTKGARITSHIALPGRYLVYMPTIDHIGVSRKISSEEERLRLRNIILENRGSLTGGFIVRTAGQGRSGEEFKADLRFLSALWSEIKAQAEKVKSPALVHRDLDLVQRLLRDTVTPDFKCIRVDSEIEYERVLEFVNRSQPSLVGKVKLYTRDTPLFEAFGIQAEIEKALRPKVWLKSGGYIVINQTEALVAVDVNTGKYVGKTNRLEDTILKTNIDAVNEIVRQIRLRDLGGIIVVDFIDMDERKNRIKVIQALEEALRHDRAPTKVISFHDFGLVAITRKRVKQSLERTLCEPCSSCAGSGWIKSVATVCYEILAEAKKMAKEIEGDVLTLRVNPEVAKALKSREGALVSELESMTHKDVIIKSDPVVEQERFEIF
jgi:ribonuclease G